MNSFDDLVLLINDIGKNKGNECLICQFPIDDKSQEIQLKCKHYYHKKCLFPFKINYYKCPYCNVITHRKEIIEVKNLCKAIFKSGKKKGEVCNRNNCKIHKNVQNVQNDNKCTVIIKTGKNKGKVCNRLNCKIHNKTIVV